MRPTKSGAIDFKDSFPVDELHNNDENAYICHVFALICVKCPAALLCEASSVGLQLSATCP